MMLAMTSAGPSIDVPTPLLDELIDAGRTVVARGLVLASGGNLSARVPGTDAFVVTGTGTWLDRLVAADFTVMGMDGTRRSGAERPSVEWKLHHRTYAVREDVAAVVHLHPQHVLLVDVLGQPIRLVTSDHQAYLGTVGRIPFIPAGSQEVADAAAEQAREHNAVVLAHHGCSALGDTVAMALRRAMNLEEAATMTYRLLLAGDTTAQFPPEWVGRIVEA